MALRSAWKSLVVAALVVQAQAAMACTQATTECPTASKKIEALSEIIAKTKPGTHCGTRFWIRNKYDYQAVCEHVGDIHVVFDAAQLSPRDEFSLIKFPGYSGILVYKPLVGQAQCIADLERLGAIVTVDDFRLAAPHALLNSQRNAIEALRQRITSPGGLLGLFK